MRPPSRLPVVDWCRANVVLPHSNKSPLWDIEGSPWLREPMACAADNRNREIVLVAPTGSGKTTLVEGLVPWIVAESPGNILYVTQTDETASVWAEERLMPSLRLCAPLDSLWPRDRHKIRKTELIFPHMAAHIGGAGISNLQEKSVRWVMLDEAWTYKPGRIQMARRRTHEGWNSRVVIMSQAGFDGGDLHEAWEQTDQCEFCHQCSSCGAVLPWAFHRLKWDDAKHANGKRDWRAIAAGIRHECDCGHVTRDTPEARRAMSSTGRYVPGNRESVPRHRGFHLNAMSVWWSSWFDLVREFLLAGEEKERGNLEPLKLWNMQRMANFWKDETLVARTNIVGAGYTKGQFVNGERTENEVLRFFTVDKQRDHFWGVVRAWSADGASRLIWEGRIGTWETIDAIREQYGVPPTCTFVDGRWDTGNVYDECGKRGWTALLGSGDNGYVWTDKKGNKILRAFSYIQKALSPSGKVCHYVRWSDERVKDSLILLRTGRGMPWVVPDDISEDYVKQIDSEHKVPVTNSRTGQTREIWVRIKSRDNHLWDCECMQVAAAMMARILGESASDTEVDDDKP